MKLACVVRVGHRTVSRRRLLAALAQPQGKVRRIGFLLAGEGSDYAQRFEAFKAGMRELGYAEGRDYTIEQRFAQADLGRLPAFVAELLTLKVDMIVAPGTPSALAARKVTRETPILVVTVGDPVGNGLATSLSRPGGNVTGLTSVATDLYTKRLDFLRQIVPGLNRVGFLYNSDNANDVLNLRGFESDCKRFELKSLPVTVRKAEDVAAALETLKRDKAQGLILTSNTIVAWRERIIDQVAKHRLPAVYGLRVFAESGGLISYAANTLDLYRRAAAYADKIFKGAKPGDLPIEQPTKFELVINLKTARAIGITIPQSILVSADKVIE